MRDIEPLAFVACSAPTGGQSRGSRRLSENRSAAEARNDPLRPGPGSPTLRGRRARRTPHPPCPSASRRGRGPGQSPAVSQWWACCSRRRIFHPPMWTQSWRVCSPRSKMSSVMGGPGMRAVPRLVFGSLVSQVRQVGRHHGLLISRSASPSTGPLGPSFWGRPPEAGAARRQRSWRP